MTEPRETVGCLTRGELKTRTQSIFYSLYFTLVSIIQGVAFGFLIYSWFNKPAGYLILADQKFLHHLIGFFVIAIVSFEYTTVYMFTHWPLTCLDILISLLLGVTQVLPVYAWERPEVWWTYTGYLCMSGVAAYLNTSWHIQRFKYIPEEGFKVVVFFTILSIVLSGMMGIASFIFSKKVAVSPSLHPIFLWVFIGFVIGYIAKEQWWAIKMYRVYRIRYR